MSRTLCPTVCALSRSARCLSTTASIPPATTSIDSVATFLKKIGRGTHAAAASKMTDWDKLFTMSSAEFKEAGLSPRQRKYLLLWREKFRQGEEPYALPVMHKVHGGERKRKALGFAKKK